MELEEKAGQAIADMVDVPGGLHHRGRGLRADAGDGPRSWRADDDEKIQQLPDTTGMKNEILIQRRQRYWYDRCLELAGAKLVEYGSDERTTRADLEEAIGPQHGGGALLRRGAGHRPERAVLGGHDRDCARTRSPGDGGRRRDDLSAGHFRQVRPHGRGLPVHRGEVPGRNAVCRPRAGHRGYDPQAVATIVRRLRGAPHPRGGTAAEGGPPGDGGRGGRGAALDDDEPRGAAGVPSRRGARRCWGF